jgi:hypothetical protein
MIIIGIALHVMALALLSVAVILWAVIAWLERDSDDDEDWGHE